MDARCAKITNFLVEAFPSVRLGGRGGHGTWRPRVARRSAQRRARGVAGWGGGGVADWERKRAPCTGRPAGAPAVGRGHGAARPYPPGEIGSGEPATRSFGRVPSGGSARPPAVGGTVLPPPSLKWAPGWLRAPRAPRVAIVPRSAGSALAQVTSRTPKL